MADIDNNSGLVSEVTSHVEMNGNNEEASHLDGDIVDQVGVDATDEEMLQNALVDATHGFTAVQLQYTEENEGLQDGVLINSGIQFINDPTSGQENNDQLPESFVADNSDVNFINGTGFLNETDKTDAIEYVTNQDEHSSNLQEQPIAINDAQYLQSSDVTQQQIIVQQHLPQSGAPLGSSQNPIRIIQQGNHYTPVQQLSTDQLQQIMQVVQQQQVGKNIAAGSSVLFNPQTNTRIVYRVIYPSQLHKDGDSGKSSEQTVIASIPRRTYKKRIKEDDQEKVDGPELSREEKEQRKKTRPKTRSGRVSKPPKHMVKDFKHIHVLDYDEDYDDSDGGYSDFKYEGEDEPPDRKDDDDNFVSYATGVDSMKPKRWKCITCEKAYIGRAGLARHLRLNPLHGSIDVEGEGDMEPPDASITPVSGEDVTPSTPATPNGFNSTANSTASFSEDSRDSSISLTFTPTRRPRSYRGRGRLPRGSWRGRGAYNKVDPETKRINKLKEITKECSDEELMEIVLPRLAKVITLWEFLLMKVEKGNPAWPHADDIYREYVKLHQHMKKLCEEYLQFVSEPETAMEDQHTLLQVEHTAVAQSLGLHVGAHKVREIADTDTDIQYKYKFLTTNQSVDFHYTNKSFLKRTVEVVSPEQIVSPAKKHKPAPIRSSHDRNLISSEDTAAISVNNANANMNTAQFISKIKVLSPAKVSQYCTSGKANSGKTVSLLSNSFNKHSQSSTSSSSSLSSLPSLSSSSLSKSSQKVLIVSGRNSIVERSSASTLGAISEPVRTSSVQLPAPSSVNQPGDQLVTLTNGQDLNSQNRIILHDNVTGTYTVCSVSENLTNTSPSSTNHAQNCTSQPVIISLPPSSSPQYIQPKFDVNDMNMLNHVPSETNNFQQIITSVADENVLTHQILNIKEMDNVNCIPSESNEGSSVANLDPNTQNVVFTLANGDPVQLTTDDSGGTGNIAYTLTNGDPSQENVIFTVDPDSMLVSELNNDQSVQAANDRENAGINHLLQTNGKDEVVGVINSIDTSAPAKGEPKSIMESSSDISWQLVDNVSTVDDAQQLLNTTQMNGNALVTDGTLDEDHTQLAAIINDGDKMSGLKTSSEYETVSEDAIQGETIQIPATNIYQTEDGLIFIQNPDGTTLQLQGSDGQALSMETVQALLGTSQFIAEENPTA